MFFRFNIFFLSLLFAFNLWAASNFENYSTWVGIVFSSLIIFGSRLIVKRWSYSFLPVAFVPGSVFLLFLIDSSVEQRFFAVFATAVFYFAVLSGWRLKQYGKDQTAIAMNDLATIATLFCWFAAASGWYMNVALPIWGLIFIFSIISFLAAFSSFYISRIDGHKRLIYSVFLTFLVAQTAWVQSFWPFGYLTLAVIALIIYCVSWELIISYFREKLSIRTIVFEILFLAGSILLILFSTKWYPVI